MLRPAVDLDSYKATILDQLEGGATQEDVLRELAHEHITITRRTLYRRLRD